MLLSHNEPINLACIKKTLLLEWFGRQISERVSQLFRSQCVKVTSYRAATRRSEGQESMGAGVLVGLLAGPSFPVSCVCESLERCSSRSCRVSLVYGVIQHRLWNRAGPWKYSRWKQNEGKERESEARHASLALSQRWGEKGQGGLPTGLSVTGDVIKLFPFVTGDCTGIEGEQLEQGSSPVTL